MYEAIKEPHVTQAVFGCCKTFSGKYIFSGNANFWKRKIFQCVWLHFKKFSGKNFLVFGKEEGKYKSRKHKPQPRKKKSSTMKMFPVWRPRRRLIAISRSHRSQSRTGAGARAVFAVVGLELARSARTGARSSPAIGARSLSLSLSLIFRKCFEGKIEV